MKISLIATAFFWALTVLHADVVSTVGGDDPPVRWSRLTRDCTASPTPESSVGAKSGIATDCPLGQVTDSPFTLPLLSQDWNVVEDDGLDDLSVASAKSGHSNVVDESGPVENLAKEILQVPEEPNVRSP
jgi:hypothetical protein